MKTVAGNTVRGSSPLLPAFRKIARTGMGRLAKPKPPIGEQVQLLHLPHAARSFKGRTADFESAYAGSNPTLAFSMANRPMVRPPRSERGNIGSSPVSPTYAAVVQW